MNENTNQSKVKFEVGKTYKNYDGEYTVIKRTDKSVWIKIGKKEVRRGIEKDCSKYEWITPECCGLSSRNVI